MSCNKFKLPCNFFKQFDGIGLTKKILVYPATRIGGDDYDPYENNLTYTNLNPITVHGIVRSVSPETSFFKHYGQHISGSKEILTEARWKNAFINANKIVIDGIDYQCFKDSGSRLFITDRPLGMIKVLVNRLD